MIRENSRIEITIIYDDINGAKPGFIKSFGFSVLIKIEDKIILFDTGTNKKILLANLKTYGLSPSSINAVVLSHNHNDHTNGLRGLLKNNAEIPVYVHKDWNIRVSYEGFPIPKQNIVVVKKGGICDELSSRLYITESHFSHAYGGIYEQACYIELENSYILLCGCCHPGLDKFLGDRSILGIAQESPLHIIGGLHNFKFNRERAKKLFPIIKSLTLCHCTSNITTFIEQFEKKCRKGILGESYYFL